MKKTLLLFTLLCPLFFYGQITVDSSINELDAMEVLLGENVTVSNVTFSGFIEQIGTFSCVECGLDFEDGIIIATGNVETAIGPNQSGSNSIGGDFGGDSDVDLDILNPNSAGSFNDIAVLEFDFIALGDSVWFDYVFASDEYPEFSGSTFNDTFGFFMSGPGITGTYSDNSANLALIPGTDIGVTINNVNAGTLGTAVEGDDNCNNCEFYENNGTGQVGQSQYDDPNVVGYDGYTVGLRAIRGGLICGETYHLRIVIADAGDNGYDSAVILRAGSLSSNLTVQVNLDIQATNEDGVMNEECGLSTLTFSRPEAIASDLPFIVNIAYLGVAENGVDYTLLPEQIVFDPGVDVISFTLDAFEDGVIEGLESVILDMQSVAVCEGESVPSSFEFFITESAPLEVSGYEVEICDGGEVEISPILVNGSGGFEYVWSTSETTPEITVSPIANTTYSVSISDTCLVSSAAADITVNVAQFPALEITSDPNEVEIDCNWFGEFITFNASGGNGSYTYEYSSNGGESTTVGNSFFLSNENSEVIGYVTDGCGTQQEVELELNFTIPELDIQYPDTVFTCPGEFSIEPIITGGTEPYNISWFDQDFNFTTDPFYNGTATEETSVNLNISDGCGLGINEGIVIFVQSPVALEINAGTDLFASCESSVNLLGEVIAGVEPFTYTWQTIDNEAVGSNILESVIITEDQTFVLFVDDNCGQSQSDTLVVTLDDTPLEIILPNILTGDCQTLFEIEAETNLENANITMTWSGDDGLTIVGDNTVTYQSLESGMIQVSGDAGCGNTAQASTEIAVVSPPVDLEVSPDSTICLNGFGTLTATGIGGTGELSYDWIGVSSTENSVIVSPSSITTYEVTVIDECLNQETDAITISVENIEATYTSISDEPYSYLFIPSLSPDCPDCTYLWTFSDGNISNEVSPFYSFGEIGFVGAFLEVTSPAGCVSEFSDLLNIPPIVFIPNSFTPDNDGINDAFFVTTAGIDKYELTIFNRWGEIVFQSEDPAEAWIGNNMNGEHYVSEGVYSYVLKYRGLDSDSQSRIGTVTVIR